MSCAVVTMYCVCVLFVLVMFVRWRTFAGLEDFCQTVFVVAASLLTISLSECLFTAGLFATMLFRWRTFAGLEDYRPALVKFNSHDFVAFLRAPRNSTLYLYIYST